VNSEALWAAEQLNFFPYIHKSRLSLLSSLNARLSISNQVRVLGEHSAKSRETQLHLREQQTFDCWQLSADCTIYRQSVPVSASTNFANENIHEFLSKLTAAAVMFAFVHECPAAHRCVVVIFFGEKECIHVLHESRKHSCLFGNIGAKWKNKLETRKRAAFNEP
jgi:hypothetical protein